jgi:membrane associated rhomboid family serine protease
VVGASGVVFGMAGLTLADMMLNFETLSRPLLRSAVMLAFLAYFAGMVGTTPAGTSHMSHVGGILCGLLSAVVLLRNPHRSRVEWAAMAVGAAGCLAIFVALPLLFYLHQLPRISC